MKAKKIFPVVLGCALTVLGPMALAQSSEDKSFVKDAAEGGLGEVELGRLAEQKAMDPQVKQFGHRMVVDHTRLNNEMKPQAERLQVSLPTSPNTSSKATYEELKMKSGADFDKAYIKAMVKDHHEDLQDFDKELNSTQDASLKATVSKGRAVIAEHTRMADELAKKLGVS